MILRNSEQFRKINSQNITLNLERVLKSVFCGKQFHIFTTRSLKKVAGWHTWHI